MLLFSWQFLKSLLVFAFHEYCRFVSSPIALPELVQVRLGSRLHRLASHNVLCSLRLILSFLGGVSPPCERILTDLRLSPWLRTWSSLPMNM